MTESCYFKTTNGHFIEASETSMYRLTKKGWKRIEEVTKENFEDYFKELKQRSVEKVIVKTIQNGQPEPYADSYWQYEIIFEHDITKDQAEKFISKAGLRSHEGQPENKIDPAEWWEGYFTLTIKNNICEYFSTIPYLD